MNDDQRRADTAPYLNSAVGRFAKFLPQTNSRLLRVVVVGMVMACLWFAVAYLQGAISGRYDLGALSFILWLPLAVGLWRLMPWARYVSLGVLSLIILVAPVVVGPFEAINGEAPPLPVWEQLMYSFAPLYIPAIFCMEVLYAHKHEFSWPRVSCGVEEGARSPIMLPRSWILWCTALLVTPILLVAMLNLRMWLDGGCMAVPGHGLRYRQVVLNITVWVCVIAGASAFLRAAPPNSTCQNRIAHALLYTAGMFWFHSNVSGYLTVFAGPCE